MVYVFSFDHSKKIEKKLLLFPYSLFTYQKLRKPKIPDASFPTANLFTANFPTTVPGKPYCLYVFSVLLNSHLNYDLANRASAKGPR